MILDTLLNSANLRWSASFVLALGVHAGAVVAALNWNTPEPPQPSEPLAAIAVELAPLPVAPETPPIATAPGPEQVETEPVLESAPEPEPKPLPEITETTTAEAVLPTEPEPAEETEERQEAQPEQREQAPPSIEAPSGDVAAAPESGAMSLVPSDATVTWQSVLLGHLGRHKRYPRESRRRRQEAVVYVRVQINRDGTVVDYRLERQSRHEALNQESLALIARAQPLPPPPEALEGNIVEFVVPIEFSLIR